MLFVIVVVFLLSFTDIIQGRTIDSRQTPDGLTIHKVIRTWKEADLHCKLQGAVLASPITTELMEAMRALIAINNTPYFIGTRSSDSLGLFTSMEGVPLDSMTAAVTQMVQQLDPRDGDCLSMDQHSIRVVPCCARLPYLCYRAQTGNTNITKYGSEFGTGTERIQVNGNVTTEPAIKSRYACETVSEGYTYYEATGSCYKIHRETLKWDDAKASCEAEGAHLAVVNNVREAETIMTMDIARGYPNTFIGLRYDEERGQWRSIDGKGIGELYSNWKKGTPDPGELYCVAFIDTGRIDNFSCLYARQFLCEIENV